MMSVPPITDKFEKPVYIVLECSPQIKDFIKFENVPA